MLPFCSLVGGASHVTSMVCDVDDEQRNINGLADGTKFNSFQIKIQSAHILVVKLMQIFGIW